MPRLRSLPRFTIRRLMVAVAVAALLLGGGVWLAEMRARSDSYRRRAFEFGRRTLRYGSVATGKGGRWVSTSDNENDWRRDAWAYGLAEKYWRLADRPWLAVEPDPPQPEPLAHPRAAVDLPADYPERIWQPRREHPWWAFPWTWRTRMWWYMGDMRYSW